MFEVLKYYSKNSLHLLSFDFIGNELKLVIVNDKNELIKKIKVFYINDLFEIECNSNLNVIEISLKNVSINTAFYEPKLVSYYVDEKEIFLDYECEEKFMTRKKSLSKMGDEKYLIKREFSKQLNLKRKKIKFVPEKYDDFWICLCGQYNYTSQDECYLCHSKKEKIFSLPLKNENEFKKRKIVNSNFFMLTLLFPLYVIYFIVIYLLSFRDPIFSNELAFSLIGKINIYGTSLLYPIFTFGIVLFQKRYQTIFVKLFEILRLILIIYINYLILFHFVYFSYMFYFILLFDGYYIYYAIYYIFNNAYEKKHIVLLVCSTCCLISSFFELGYWKQNNMKVKEDGISLVCNSNPEIYRIPKKINGMEVSSITFDLKHDYSNIKEIVIPKTMKRLHISSSFVLPNLEKITIVEGNSSFYNHNGILFYNDGRLSLVPQKLEEVVVDWDVITASSFEECRNLKKVLIKSNCTKIDHLAFSNCFSLEEFKIEENSNLVKLGDNVFSGCKKLKELILPDSIERIGDSILKGCDNIKNLSLPFLGEYRYTDLKFLNKNALGYSFGSDYRMENYNNLNLETVTLTSQKILGNSAFYGCNAKKIKINNLNGHLGKFCFYNTNIEEFEIPEGIEEIEDECFMNSSIKKLIFSKSLKKIGKNAFKGCDSLDEIDINGTDLNKIQIDETNKNILKFLFI